MGKVISAKLTGQHSELLAWMEQQAESPNALILLALYTLKDMREGHDLPGAGLIIEAGSTPNAALPAPVDPPTLEEPTGAPVVSLADLIAALEAITPGLGKVIGSEVADRLEPLLHHLRIAAADADDEPAPVMAKSKRDELLDTMLSGLDDWSNVSQ